MPKDKAYIILEAKTKEATDAVRGFDKDTEKAFDRVKQNARNASTGMGGSLQKLKQHWVAYSAAAVAALLIVRKAIRGMISTIKDLVKASNIQEDAEKALNLALITTGRYTAELSQHFKDLASAIQAETRVGDEATLQITALLVQLTKLDREGLDAATKGAIGLASVFKMDVSAAANLVGKALAGNIGALSRYGITVEKNLTQEQKHASILQQLGVMYERAKGEVETFAGAQAQAANLFGDLKEKIGDIITKNRAVIDLFKSASKYLGEMNQRLQTWITHNRELIDQKTEKVIKTIAGGVKDIAIFGYDAARAAVNLYTALDKFHLLKPVKDTLKGIADAIKYFAELGKEDIINKVTMKVPLPTETWVKPGAAPGAPGGALEAMDAYIKKAKEMAAIEYALPFDWEQYLPPAEIDTSMDAYIKRAKEMAAIEYAPPFDYEQWITGFNEISDKGTKAFDDLKNAVTGWASTFSAQLNQLLWDAETTFRDILKAFAQMVTQMLIQAYVVKPFLGWLGIPLAKGGVIDQGELVPLARGGIVDRPTVFPMARGVGLMGEKGPEAIMPLARTPGGDLGVKTSGGSGQKGDVIIIMENPVFQDLATQRQVFANIASQIAKRVAPGAVVRSYDNDGPIRTRVRRGI